MAERILARRRVKIGRTAAVISATKTGVFYEAGDNGVTYLYFRHEESRKVKHIFGNIAGRPDDYVLTFRVINGMKDYFEGLKRKDGKQENAT